MDEPGPQAMRLQKIGRERDADVWATPLACVSAADDQHSCRRAPGAGADPQGVTLSAFGRGERQGYQFAQGWVSSRQALQSRFDLDNIEEAQ